MSSSWRFVAQRAVTGEFLHLDLPLRDVEIGWALSGAGTLSATLAPDDGGIRDESGRLLIEEWGTLLYAEADGVIRWGGIVTSSTFEGAEWKIEGAQFSTYLFGLPYTGSWGGVQVDPLDAVREIWRYAQSYHYGDLGVVVDSDRSPVRLGDPGVPAYGEVFVDGKWQKKSGVPAWKVDPSAKTTLAKPMTSKSSSATLKSLDHFDTVTYPATIKIGAETVTAKGRSGLTLTGLTRGVGSTSPTTHAVGVTVSFTGTQSRTVDAVAAEPYRLDWFEAKDCGEELNSLAQETPFDYAETHAWNADKTGITHRFVLGYPRLGRRRDDLAFIEGDNVTEVVSITRDGGSYANSVYGIGAGEGAKSLRRNTAYVDGRLRRPVIYTDKGATRTASLDAAIAAELTRRRGLVALASIDVVDHPNARVGSWDLGDDVLVQASVPWLGTVSVWHRITGWSWLSDTRARLTLVRSDSLDYGGSRDDG